MVIKCKREERICIGKTAIIFDYDSTNLFIDTIHEATGKANLLHRITTTRPIGSSGTAIYNYEMYEGWNEHQPSGTCNFRLQWVDNNLYIVTGTHSVIKIDSIRRDNESVVDFYKAQLKNVKLEDVSIDNLFINNKQQNLNDFKVVYRSRPNRAVELKIKARPAKIN
jgi:hypothetical protein